MHNRAMTFLVSSLMLITLFASGVTARQFDSIGSRGNGMGGAGVANIDDENAPQWNPANLSLPSDYEGDYSTSLGIQAGAEIQSTNDFLQNSKDLVDFFEANENNPIFDGNNYDNNRETFIDLLSLTRDLEGDDKGALLYATGGLNGRHTNWSISANNITDAAAYSELDLTGGINLGNSQVQDAVADGTNPSRSPDDQKFEDVADACESSFSGDWDPENDFGFDPGTEKSDLANFVADFAEDNNISADKTKKACKSADQILEQSADPGVSGDDFFDTDAQRLVFEGASVSEVNFSYANPTPIMSLASSPLYLGTNLRLMQAEVAYIEENPFNTSAADENDEVFDEEEDLETSTDFGVDIGLTYDAREQMGVTFGLVGKYLNTPTFDYPDNEAARDTPVRAPDELEIEPQARFGLSLYPLDFMPVDMGTDWWQLSADYDITKNETLLQDYEKQYVSVGNEFNFINSFWGNLALRVGARDNMAESKEGILYTGGVGLQLAGLNIEVSGVLSDKTTRDDDGDEIPTLAGGTFNLAYRF